MKKDIIKKFIYNAIATTLPTVLLQLLILPLIAKQLDGDAYGLLLTIVAAVMMFAAGIGNVLNNVHMLSNNEYEERKLFGDYGILLSFCVVITSFIIIAVTWKYGVTSAGDYILNLLFGVTLLVKEYYIVRLWIDLDYGRILKCNLLCCVGYLLGLGIFWLGAGWQIIYITGNILSIIYLYIRYGFSKEYFSKTPLFAVTAMKCFSLSVATVLSRSLQYVDRMLLYPLLGGEDVSVYYVATLMGKTISMALAPINSFLLSQLAKRKSIKQNTFGRVLILSLFAGGIGYIACLLLSGPILTILYPQWAGAAMKYIYVTTGTAILSAISMVISPIVLKFCNLNWQILIQGVCLLVYVGVSLIMLKQIGLMGFCVGGLIANFVTLVLMVIIFLMTRPREEGENKCAE